MTMKNITIALANKMVDSLEILVDLGFYPSRSEIIREGLKKFLMKEKKYEQLLEPKNLKALKMKQIEFLKGNSLFLKE